MKKRKTLDEVLFAVEKKRAGTPLLYHNTRELLKIYSKVIWCMEHSVRELDAECIECGYESLYDTLSYLASSIDCELDSLHLEERTRSLLFTRSLVDIINRALVMLKDYPGKGERYFEIINKMHVLKYQYSEDEILGFLNISRRTLFREKKEALDMLGVILWGFLIPDLIEKLRGTIMAPDLHQDGTQLALFCD